MVQYYNIKMFVFLQVLLYMKEHLSSSLLSFYIFFFWEKLKKLEGMFAGSRSMHMTFLVESCTISFAIQSAVYSGGVHFEPMHLPNFLL